MNTILKLLISISLGILIAITILYYAPKAGITQLELPEEFCAITKGDTLTYKQIDNTIVLEFYHGHTNQKNKQLIIVK